MSKADIKFWNCPELVEKLVLFLDNSSIAPLASAHEPVLNVIKNRSVWNKLMRRSCPTSQKMNERGTDVTTCDFYVRLKKAKQMMEGFVDILKILDDPGSHLLDLLDFISKRSPPFEIETKAVEELKNVLTTFEGNVAANAIPGSEFFQLSSSCLRPLAVSPFGFLLLEAMEDALGTTEQRVEWVLLEYLSGPWLKALGTRLSRQQSLGVKVKVDSLKVSVTGMRRTESLLSIMQNCQSMSIRDSLNVDYYIGTEGWTAVRKVVSNTQVKHLDCLKRTMADAKKEDLKVIVEGLSERLTVRLGDYISTYSWEKREEVDLWYELEQFMESSEGQLSSDEERESEDGDTTEDEFSSEDEVDKKDSGVKFIDC